jgi:hypothetical protein
MMWQAQEWLTGMRFPGRRPRGSPVSQAIGESEKNWLRFAIYIVLTLSSVKNLKAIEWADRFGRSSNV